MTITTNQPTRSHQPTNQPTNQTNQMTSLTTMQLVHNLAASIAAKHADDGLPAMALRAEEQLTALRSFIVALVLLPKNTPPAIYQLEHLASTALHLAAHATLIARAVGILAETLQAEEAARILAHHNQANHHQN